MFLCSKSGLIIDFTSDFGCRRLPKACLCTSSISIRTIKLYQSTSLPNDWSDRPDFHKNELISIGQHQDLTFGTKFIEFWLGNFKWVNFLSWKWNIGESRNVMSYLSALILIVIVLVFVKQHVIVRITVVLLSCILHCSRVKGWQIYQLLRTVLANISALACWAGRYISTARGA